MKQAVCTLFDGHDHPGVGALVNSLHASGFSGRVICGHRGREPFWAEAARGLTGGIDVRFVPITTLAPLGRHQPVFMQECWAAHSADAQHLYYFDPGIVLKTPWAVLARSAAGGVALCERDRADTSPRHPSFPACEDFLRDAGLPPARALERRFHSGFIGLPRNHRHLLEIWAQIIARAEHRIGALSRIKFKQPPAFLPSPERDALDLALMVLDVPIVHIGAAAVPLLSHVGGPRQPWRGGFLRDALRGQPPESAQKLFFRFAESPLRLFPAAELARLRLSLRSGALLGRLYRRARFPFSA